MAMARARAGVWVWVDSTVLNNCQLGKPVTTPPPQHSRAYITGPRLRDNRMKMVTFIKKLYIHNIFLSIVIRFFLQMMV